MTGAEAVAYLERFSWSRTRLGLDRTRALLRLLGEPQKRLRFVHVAGSNGKGSTCAMLDAIFRAAGYKTGLYTSPYVENFGERIRINGENIPDEALARWTERIAALADAMDDHPSQFELITALALGYFAEQGCEIVVLEVGMGGALDATNVIDAPEAAVITNLGLEHTEYLGHTLSEIAAAKGGIIKPGCTAVCYESAAEAMDTLRKICRERGADFCLSSGAELRVLSHSLDGQRIRWREQTYRLALIGAHQCRNAGVVLETVAALRRRGWAIPEQAVERGLANVRWPARFELLRREPPFILDGGHNPQCAEALAQTLSQELPGETLTVLMGVLADKDYPAMVEAVAPFAARFLCVTPDSPRALTAGALCAHLQARGCKAETFDSVEAAVRAALEEKAPVLAFGSLYMAGALRRCFFAQQKALQRGQALSARRALTERERREKSAAICRNLLDSDSYRRAQTLLLYLAQGSEAELSAVADRARAEGKRLLYPRAMRDGQLFAVEDDGRRAPDAYGIPAPEGEAVPPEEIDLVVCPCAAFDGEGRRLGMGAGCYDRFLPQCEKAAVLLAAFETQRLPRVCAEGFDRKVDAVVTEDGIFCF